MSYPTAEQRGINRNIHNRPKVWRIHAPQAHETFTRRVSGGFIRRICGRLVHLWRIENLVANQQTVTKYASSSEN